MAMPLDRTGGSPYTGAMFEPDSRPVLVDSRTLFDLVDVARLAANTLGADARPLSDALVGSAAAVMLSVQAVPAPC